MSIILVKKGMLKLKNSKWKKILITVPAPLILCRKQSVKIHETTYFKRSGRRNAKFVIGFRGGWGK